jgi:hypothetical protein
MQESAFDALADTDRQRLLLALADTDGALAVPEDLPTPDDAAAIRYHHVHLPKLDAHGYVDWDPGDDTVKRGPRYADLEPLLDTLRVSEKSAVD